MSCKKEIEVAYAKDGERYFKQYGKMYTLSDEIVKGGCQSCAFYNRMDCRTTNRTDYCSKLHKIFKLRLEHE